LSPFGTLPLVSPFRPSEFVFIGSASGFSRVVCPWDSLYFPLGSFTVCFATYSYTLARYLYFCLRICFLKETASFEVATFRFCARSSWRPLGPLGNSCTYSYTLARYLYFRIRIFFPLYPPFGPFPLGFLPWGVFSRLGIYYTLLVSIYSYGS